MLGVNRSGQALIMALLILGIAMTVGLSVMTRSLTDINVSTTSDEAARALEAAEAGVERSLGGIIAGPGEGTVGSTGSTYSVENGLLAGPGSSFYRVPYSMTNGDSATINMTGYPANGSVRICWGEVISSASAVEVAVYYNDASGQTRVGKAGYSGGGRSGFSPAGSGGCPAGVPARFAQSINMASDLGVTGGSNLLFMRIRVLYNTDSQPVTVVANSGTIPVQGQAVTSTGQSGTASQKLYVVTTNPDLPFMFDMALFSGTGLVQ